MISPKFADPQQQSEDDRKRQMVAAMLIKGGSGTPRHGLEAFGNAMQQGIGQRLQDPRSKTSAFPAAPGSSPLMQIGQQLRNMFGSNSAGGTGGLY